ncbi:MAG: hypothetical protein F6J87_21490 [Spirulina sp. SIO3F2]|nr:hypothetical protein [Spirulina sp. SIO3F2]
MNKAEWRNPNNWSTIYFSKKDSRACVPKQNPAHGWTINFGSPAGSLWIYYLLVLFWLLGFGVGMAMPAVRSCFN